MQNTKQSVSLFSMTQYILIQAFCIFTLCICTIGLMYVLSLSTVPVCLNVGALSCP